MNLLDKFLKKHSELIDTSLKSIADLAASMNNIVITLKALVVEVNENVKNIAELQMIVNQLVTDVYGASKVGRSPQRDKTFELDISTPSSKKKNTVN